ncbi:hypothetical protein PCL1606_29480 [Pseudomonas chlororaphis]|uniref:Fimbrial protein n=2 Tax=Pseudomonas chlororaphis TaxID=587753 RepID=A0A0D5Y0A0_9PSED|nr:hypothetical protein PCL1606_29480 [Pseudomonas chlororaphis]
MFERLGRLACCLAMLVSPFTLAVCQQVGPSSITPSVAEVPIGGGGMLSSAWHQATFHVTCSVSVSNGSYTNEMLASGVFAGSSITFEGKSYRLYKTNNADVMYFGDIAGSDNIPRPFGTSYVHGMTASYGKLDYPVTVRVRYYSPSASMKPGQYSIAANTLVNGRLKYGSTVLPAEGTWSMSASSFNFGVKGATCTLSLPSAVVLKKIMVGDLPAVDSVAAAGSFQLTINCGANTIAYNLNARFIDVLDPGNSSTSANFTTYGPTASGYGLQFLNAGRLITLGPSGDNPLGNTPGGAYVLNKMIDVRYVRTDKKTAPGKGATALTILLEHQ